MMKLSKALVQEENWSSDIKTKWKAPEGTFTKKASGIVDILLKGANNDVTKAIQRINFYINRGGDDLPNKTEVLKAKDILVNKESVNNKNESNMKKLAEKLVRNILCESDMISFDRNNDVDEITDNGFIKAASFKYAYLNENKFKKWLLSLDNNKGKYKFTYYTNRQFNELNKPKSTASIELYDLKYIEQNNQIGFRELGWKKLRVLPISVFLLLKSITKIS